MAKIKKNKEYWDNFKAGLYEEAPDGILGHIGNAFGDFFEWLSHIIGVISGDEHALRRMERNTKKRIREERRERRSERSTRGSYDPDNFKSTKVDKFPDDQKFVKAHYSKDGMNVFYVEKNGDVFVKSRTSKTTGADGFASLSWMNNNPGNLKYSDFSRKHGAIGKDEQGHAIFPSMEAGESARKALLKGKSYNFDKSGNRMGISAALDRYAELPEGEYYNRIKDSVDGITPNTQLKTLNNRQFDQLLKAMRREEGMYEGKISKVITNDLRLSRQGAIKGKFAEQRSDHKHMGEDRAVKSGTRLNSPHFGRVEYINTDPNRSAGRYIVINHGSGVYTTHMHLSKINVEVGQYLQKGDIFGLSGNSGIAADGSRYGAHTHTEVAILTKINGKQMLINVDPKEVRNSTRGNIFDDATQKSLIEDARLKIGKHKNAAWFSKVKGKIDQPLEIDRRISSVEPFDTAPKNITGEFGKANTTTLAYQSPPENLSRKAMLKGNMSDIENPALKQKQPTKTLENNVTQDA